MGLVAADGREPIEWLAAGDAVKLQCVTRHWGNQGNWVGIDGDGDNSVRCVYSRDQAAVFTLHKTDCLNRYRLQSRDGWLGRRGEDIVANQPRGSSFDFIATSTREVGHFWRHGKKVRTFMREPRAPGRVALKYCDGVVGRRISCRTVGGWMVLTPRGIYLTTRDIPTLADTEGDVEYRVAITVDPRSPPPMPGGSWLQSAKDWRVVHNVRDNTWALHASLATSVGTWCTSRMSFDPEQMAPLWNKEGAFREGGKVGEFAALIEWYYIRRSRAGFKVKYPLFLRGRIPPDDFVDDLRGFPAIRAQPTSRAKFDGAIAKLREKYEAVGVTLKRRETTVKSDGCCCPGPPKMVWFLEVALRDAEPPAPTSELSEEQRAAIAAFANMDTDGDGELTADEIFRALSKNNADVTLERVQEVMLKADKDKNGTISQQEYLDAVATMGAGWIGSWLGKIAARVTAVWAEPEQEPVDGEVVPNTAVWAEPEQEPIDGEVVPEGEASAAEEVAIEAAPEQPLSPVFSNRQVELGAEREFAFEPEAEA